jgi:hypothetical protein
MAIAIPLRMMPATQPVMTSVSDPLVMPNQMMNWAATAPSRPAIHAVRLDVSRTISGRNKIPASEMKSRLLAGPMRSLRCRVYSQK